jgi:hypothetical protein
MRRTFAGIVAVLLLVASSGAAAQRSVSDEAIGRLVTQRLMDEDITTVGVSVASGIGNQQSGRRHIRRQ